MKNSATKDSKNYKSLVSIIIPVYNESSCLSVFYEKLIGVIKKLENRLCFEIIFIDDGSTDESNQILSSFNDKRVKIIEFLKNFGHQSALIAGICKAKGDCVITLDCDLQHPPELIPEFIHRWQQGYQIVHSVRNDTNTSFFKKATSKLFYRLFSIISSVQIVPGLADFRLIDKEVIKTLNLNNMTVQPLRFLLVSLGFKADYLPYHSNERFSGKSKYSLKKMVILAFESIFSFSQIPLLISFFVSGVIALISLLYGMYVFYIKYFTNTAVPGWSSIMFLVLLFGSIQFLTIGIIGAYIGTIAKQIRQQPRYIVSGEKETKSEKSKSIENDIR